METQNWWALAAAAAGMGLAGCTGDGVSQDDYQAALDQTRKLRLQVEELEEKVTAAEEAAEAAKSSSSGTNPAELEKKIDELLQENETKDAELEALKKDFREYKAKYRLTVREKLVGKQVASIQTSKGLYEEVTVREITAVGLRISHKDGSGRIRFEDLDKTLQDQLGYDEEEAAEILEQELEKQAALAALAAEAREANQPPPKSKEELTLSAKANELSRLERWLEGATSQHRKIKNEALSFDAKERLAKQRGRVSYWGPKAKAAHAKAESLKLRMDEARRQIRNLKLELR